MFVEVQNRVMFRLRGSRTDVIPAKKVIGTTVNWAEPSPAPFAFIYSKGVRWKLKLFRPYP